MEKVLEYKNLTIFKRYNENKFVIDNYHNMEPIFIRKTIINNIKNNRDISHGLKEKLENFLKKKNYKEFPLPKKGTYKAICFDYK